MVFPLWCSSNPAGKETKVTHRLSKDRHFLGYYNLKLQFRALCEIPRTDGLIFLGTWKGLLIFLKKILYIYIAFLWPIQRANLVVGSIAAAGTKCATSTSLLAYEYVHSYYRRYGDLIIVQHRLVIGIFLVLNLWKLFNTLASVRCSEDSSLYWMKSIPLTSR